MAKIGFDAKRAFSNFTGLGNYSRNLLHALAEHAPEHELHLYTPKAPSSPEMEALQALPQVHTHLGKGLKAYWRTRGVVEELRRAGMALYHGLSHEIPFGISATPVRSVVTIHDLIFRTHPQLYPWFDRQVYDLKCAYACRQANRVVAISESTKRDIIRYYQVPEEKISVVYQPCARNFEEVWSEERKLALAAALALPEKFLLYVGSIAERKQVSLIVKGLAGLSEQNRVPLVVVGKGPEQANVQALASALGIADWVHFRNGVTHADLPGVYQLAQAFVYPSLYEGFGIPILEALVSGVPVVATHVSSLPEAGGPASCYVPPNDPEAMSEALGGVLTNLHLRQEMVASGRVHAQQFSFEAIGKAMAVVYASVLSS